MIFVFLLGCWFLQISTYISSKVRVPGWSASIHDWTTACVFYYCRTYRGRVKVFSSPTAKTPGQVEQLERVVQGDCAAPQRLRLGRRRRAGAGGDTAPQHHGYVAQPLQEWPWRERRAGAGRGTALQHHGHVAQPLLQRPV